MIRPVYILPLLVLAACTRADTEPDARPGAAAVTDTAAPVADPPPNSGATVGCSAEARSGLLVTISDARTGAALAGFTIVARALDSTTAGGADAANGRARRNPDSTTVPAMSVPPSPMTWGGAVERPGRYSVHVSKKGYRPWDTTNVIVTRDGCHVRTVRLDARLHPE